MTTPDLPPLPVTNYVDNDGLWCEEFGPYDADQMRDYATAAVLAEQKKSEAIRAALVELVALKDLKDEESRRRQRRECQRLRPVGNALAEVNAMRDDYNRRKPLAWAAARAALRAEQEQQP